MSAFGKPPEKPTSCRAEDSRRQMGHAKRHWHWQFSGGGRAEAQGDKQARGKVLLDKVVGHAAPSNAGQQKGMAQSDDSRIWV
jgi:hypothetical protein